MCEEISSTGFKINNVRACFSAAAVVRRAGFEWSAIAGRNCARLQFSLGVTARFVEEGLEKQVPISTVARGNSPFAYSRGRCAVSELLKDSLESFSEKNNKPRHAISEISEKSRSRNFASSSVEPTSGSIFQSPLPPAVSIDQSGVRPCAKRDPGDPRRTRASATRLSSPLQLARRGKRRDAKRDGEEEGTKGRAERRSGEEGEGSVERNRMERPVYLDDSPACFARRPYETG